jgi:CubicO group peptidase (beta-lactamase class C family)
MYISKHHCNLFIVFITSLMITFIVGCGPSSSELASIDYSPLPGTDWVLSSPEAEGLDPDSVAKMYYNATKLDTIYSLLIIKNEHLIAEEYFNDGSIDRKDRLQSVTKSFTSALVGLAIEDGYLSSVNQKMLNFFPEVTGKITDPRKEQITIQNMLEMRAGYPREESDQALWDALLSGQYPPLIEKFPLVSYPGTRFHYSNLTSNWLGIIVDRACGMHLKMYADERFFSLLGIESGEWGQDAEGHNNGCGDLHLTARDAAKFGLLYLNDGIYKGNQIIPAHWIHNSLQTYSVNEAFVKKVGRFRNIGYGYHWWSANAGEHHVNFAWGHGGQLIVLIDDFDMVIVTTSYPYWLENNDQSWKNEKAIISLVADFVASLPN